MEIQTDFLVIGSGVAGLSFALKVADAATVALITKREMVDANTSFAQGGVASVFDRMDSFDLHIQDTLSAGAGLCRPDVVEMVVKNAPDRILELIQWGVRFNVKNGEKSTAGAPALELGREGGHSRKRIVHAQDMTGREIERVLVEQAQSHPNIQIYEHHAAIDLITYTTLMRRGQVTTSHRERCCGAYVLSTKEGRVKTFSAKITLLATGGTGKVYLYTSNPDIATGDGISMAYRAGASVANLEFVQFHPTCLYHPDAKNFLISETVRGEGGVLLDAAGNRFMEKYDPMKDLACRDKVARAIDSEMKKSGADSVFLDISHRPADFVKKRFPNLYANCLKYGFDMTAQPVPVVPAAHYMCGGVVTDTHGRTDIKGLFAVGETACTGLHGANRLASNSLAEALVFAQNAAKAAAKDLGRLEKKPHPSPLPWDDVGTADSDEKIMVSHNWDEIRRMMWNYVGIVRSDKRLERAKRRIGIITAEIHDYYWNFKVASDLIELRNIACVADLIIQCAAMRKESRGLHYNIGYPHADDEGFHRDTLLCRTAFD